MWLFVAISGYFLLALVAILDKFIVTKERVAPSIVTFYSSAPLLVFFLCVPFGVVRLQNGLDITWALVSGGTFVVALWTMYIGFRKNDVSHAGPLIGAAIPVFTILISQIFTLEVLSRQAIFAATLLVVGSLIISFKKKKNTSGWNVGMLWTVTSGLFFAVSNITAKFLYDSYGFYSGLVWTRGAIGVIGLFLLLTPSVWKSLFTRSHPHKSGPTTASKVITVATDKVFGTTGTLLVQYAVALGSVSLVNALSGLQYAFLVILVAFISKFFPRVFKEEYTIGEIIQEIVAVGLIGAGLFLLII